MLKKLLALLLFAFPVFAQQVVPLNPQSSTFIVVAGSPFSQYQNPGIAYTFSMSPQNAVTVTFTASGVAADTLGAQLYCTTDPTDSGANFIKWPTIAQSLVGDTTTLGYAPTVMNLGIADTALNFGSGNRRQVIQSVPTGAAQCALLLNFANAGTDLLTVTASVAPATPFMFPQTADPCLVLKKSASAINIVTAGNSVLATLTTGRSIYVCGYSFTFIGASQTFALATGTSGTCTAPTTPTGAMGNSTLVAMPMTIDSSGTVYATFTNGQPLCAVTTGATVNIQGHIYYVYN